MELPIGAIWILADVTHRHKHKKICPQSLRVLRLFMCNMLQLLIDNRLYSPSIWLGVRLQMPLAYMCLDTGLYIVPARRPVAGNFWFGLVTFLLTRVKFEAWALASTVPAPSRPSPASIPKWPRCEEWRVYCHCWVAWLVMYVQSVPASMQIWLAPEYCCE